MQNDIIAQKAKEDIAAMILAIISSHCPNKQKININIQPSLESRHRNNFFLWDDSLYIAKISNDNNILNYLSHSFSNPEISFFIANIDNNKLINNTKNDIFYHNLIKNCRPQIDMGILFYLYHSAEDYYDQINKFSSHFSYHLNQFEKLRLIFLASSNYNGLAINIMLKINQDFANYNPAVDNFIFDGIFCDLIGFFCRKFMFFNNFWHNNLSNIKYINNNWQDFFIDKINHDRQVFYYQKIIDNIDNQNQFLDYCHKLLQYFSYDESGDDAQLEKQNYQNNKDFSSQDNGISSNQENIAIDNSLGQEKAVNLSQEQQSAIDNDISGNRIYVDEEVKGQEFDSKLLDMSSDNDIKNIVYKPLYRVFTTQFDKVIIPNKVYAIKELMELRSQLDIKIEKLGNISNKIQLKLKRKLLARKNINNQENIDYGFLNRKKLSNIIIKSNLENIWLYPNDQKYQNIALTILLDNSGSMRGNPIVITALACEVIAKILEKFNIKTEIIGFTTADWRGGRSRKAWEMAGRPENPGRLNDLLHIIYKNFQQNFNSSKINLGLMLKEGLLKENIDGEALLFAKSRLMQRNEERKIMMVISDGTPVDDSTYNCNEKTILTDHLHQVVRMIEKRKEVELMAIGICHDIGNFYKNAITIDNIEDLGDAMINKIIDIIPKN